MNSKIPKYFGIAFIALLVLTFLLRPFVFPLVYPLIMILYIPTELILPGIFFGDSDTLYPTLTPEGLVLLILYYATISLLLGFLCDRTRRQRLQKIQKG